jgi:two-component system, OmpR family, response regulator MprA
MESPRAHILLIDDDRALIEALKDKLEGRSYAVTIAYDGREGLALALAGQPDLIVLDVVMPQMNGWEVLDELIKDEWGKKAHVVMLSNSDDMENISHAVEHNMREYIIKGDWPLDELADKIEEKLSKE